MKIRTLIILLSLLISSFLLKYYLFNDSRLYPGVDGGYYVARTQELLNTGKINYPRVSTPPVLFYIMALMSLIVNNVFLGVKLGGVLASTLIGLTSFLFMKYLTKDDLSSLLTSGYTLFSNVNYRMTGDFVKNITGCALLPLSFYLLLKGFKDKKHLILFALTIPLSYLIHNSALGIISIILITLPITLLILNREEFPENLTYSIIIGSVLGLIALIISPAILDYLSSGASWLSGSENPMINYTLWNVYGLLTIPLIISFYNLIKDNKNKSLFLLNYLLISLITINPYISGSNAQRFLYLMFVPVSFALGYLVKKIKPLNYKIIFVIIIAVITLIQFNNMTNDSILQAQINTEEVNLMKEMNTLLPDECIIYCNNMGVAYWMEVFADCTFNGRIPQYLSNKSNSFFLIIKEEMMHSPPEETVEIIYNEGSFILLEPNDKFPTQEIEEYNNHMSGELSLSPSNPPNQHNPPPQNNNMKVSKRAGILSYILTLPIQLAGGLNEEYSNVLRVFMGFPITILCYSLVIRLFRRIIFKK